MAEEGVGEVGGGGWGAWGEGAGEAGSEEDLGGRWSGPMEMKLWTVED